MYKYFLNIFWPLLCVLYGSRLLTCQEQILVDSVLHKPQSYPSDNVLFPLRKCRKRNPRLQYLLSNKSDILMLTFFFIMLSLYYVKNLFLGNISVVIVYLDLQASSFHVTGSFVQMRYKLDKPRDVLQVPPPLHTWYELHMHFCSRDEDLPF